MPHKFHQPAAAYRKINEIRPEELERVRLLGTVKNISPTGFMLDDGSSLINIRAQPDSVGLGDVVRVFAKVVPKPDGFDLHAELIQDMNKLDIALYRTVLLNE